jgi:hypothetical protein
MTELEIEPFAVVKGRETGAARPFVLHILLTAVRQLWRAEGSRALAE